MLTIAGSGPSVIEYGQPVTIATKKQSLPSQYVAIKNARQWLKYRIDKPVMAITGCECGRCRDCPESAWYSRTDWDSYFRQFDPKPVNGCLNPKKIKASLGTLAVFMAVERFSPDIIGLIGFDHVLDERTDWEHDSIAERRAILSLVNVVDIRDDKVIHRLRSA